MNLMSTFLMTSLKSKFKKNIRRYWLMRTIDLLHSVYGT